MVAPAEDRVDDHWNPGFCRREPAKDARFASAGMNDVGLIVFEPAYEVTVGCQVGRWEDRAFQAGQLVNSDAVFARFANQAFFLSARGPAQDGGIEPRLVRQ